MELRQFRALFESGAVSLAEVAKETGLDRSTVRKYLSSTATSALPKRTSNKRVADEIAPSIVAMLRAEILIKGVVHERLVQEYSSRAITSG